MKILLIEDDLAIAAEITKALRSEGFAVDHCPLGKEGLGMIQMLEPDLVLLDLGLPDMDGGDVLASLRSASNPTPVIVLTARENTQSKVSLLDLGADDYLSKPFEMVELLARIRAVSRRQKQHNSSLITHKNVTLDLSSLELTVDGKSSILSRREFALIRLLIENPGRIKTRESLENSLYSWDEEIASNTIEVYISHLRRKLPKNFIKTIRGVGYTVSRE